ncbi:STAS domain-containing protein [Nonomuraea sp. MG754425]|uniref:STAS domain-containing protein n=1 Tax=Nonomuraea sp. MG754425 TaxID=2570319 RepID=UPI001F48BD75|nr:STAS domain-containing protein [Nonomuraea sp. MG754425]MCF6471102.1 STAS domain-containing protein [Nonomuraea sp. MG754425]
MRSADRTGFSWVVTQSDGSAVLRPAGDLDLASKEEFRNGLNEAMSCLRPPSVVVDMKGVEFCDSSGLNTLIWAANTVEGAGGRIRLTGLQPRLTRLLRMTGLDRRFHLTSAGS